MDEMELAHQLRSSDGPAEERVAKTVKKKIKIGMYISPKVHTIIPIKIILILCRHTTF